MGQTRLTCNKPAALAISEHLAGLDFDTGYRKLNYRDSSKPKETVPKETIEGKGDGEISCEEIWENGLQALDTLGELADWEEEPVEVKNGDKKKAIDQNKAIERYQKLRALIECKTNRPIPWVFEAPYLCKKSVFGKTEIPRDPKKLEEAKAIRTKVKKAIKKLDGLLEKAKLKSMQYQQCLIAFLYWFVLVPENGIGEPIDDKGNSQLVAFLTSQKIDPKTIQKIKTDFSKYLQQNGGGLGLANVGSDAEIEATALETVLQKTGWCTEQSKVMYAVLRMAGIEAFFVEPQLSVEYFMAKKRQTSIPLRSHMASGVGIKVIDENKKEGVWIVDVALKLLEADYIKEETGKWQAHPYWELSLRHFYMADLANFGKDQIGRDFSKAEQSFKTALDLGEDSTAFHAKGNFVRLLSQRAKKLSHRSKDYKKNYEDLDKNIDKYSKEAVIINPYNPVFQFNRGMYLTNKKNWSNWTEIITCFLDSIDADPRYIKPYQELGVAIHGIRKNVPDLFSAEEEKELKKQIDVIVQKHPLLKEIIIKRLKEIEL